MTPILKGTASRLGLRKPPRRYRLGDGMVVDEARVWLESVLNVEQAAFQRLYLNGRLRGNSASTPMCD